MSKLALMVHGGAWEIPPEAEEACRAGCRRALARGWAALEKGASALDACQEAIVVLEDDTIFDAGIGSHLNRDGFVQLDAILMDGRTLKAGAVAAVERLRNPIRVARLVLERSQHMMLAGPGAEQFARENGVALCNPSELVVAREVDLWYAKKHELAAAAKDEKLFGTVGAVALDATGTLAAGTSTGGTASKYPGRVGDSPLIGCGCYADNLTGAVSATGQGEAIMRMVLAKGVSDRLAAGAEPQAAAEAALAQLAERTGGHAGVILLDRAGRVGFAFNTSHMAFGYQTSESPKPIVRV